MNAYAFIPVITTDLFAPSIDIDAFLEIKNIDKINMKEITILSVLKLEEEAKKRIKLYDEHLSALKGMSLRLRFCNNPIMGIHVVTCEGSLNREDVIGVLNVKKYEGTIKSFLRNCELKM